MALICIHDNQNLDLELVNIYIYIDKIVINDSNNKFMFPALNLSITLLQLNMMHK